MLDINTPPDWATHVLQHRGDAGQFWFLSEAKAVHSHGQDITAECTPKELREWISGEYLPDILLLSELNPNLENE